MNLFQDERIKDVLFPVELKPIFIDQDRNAEQMSLFDDAHEIQSNALKKVAMVKIPRFRAITDIENNNVLAVVTNDYRLITNREALDLGRECFESMFGRHTSEGMSLFNITMPNTRSFCHIDFIHEDKFFMPWEGDKWSLFLRITNSYNRTKTLKFDLGFCRWICLNGIIFGKQSITFRYIHTYSQSSHIEFKSNVGNLEQYQAQFVERLHNLRRYYFPEAFMLPFICKVFNIKPKAEDKLHEKRWDKLIEFRDTITQLTKKYFEELGSNGYAAMNVVTDFASRPNLYISQASMIDQLQKKSSDWIDDFLVKVKEDSFKFEDYLKDYLEPTNLLRA